MFNGRYGVDKFNRTMIITALAISILNIFIPYGAFKGILTLLSTALIVYTVFRMFSRNFAQRNKELQGYMQAEVAVKQWWWNIKARFLRFKDRKNYKYYTCPRCLQKLRVPKGKGKIRVTCAKCGNKFEAKS